MNRELALPCVSFCVCVCVCVHVFVLMCAYVLCSHFASKGRVVEAPGMKVVSQKPCKVYGHIECGTCRRSQIILSYSLNSC